MKRILPIVLASALAALASCATTGVPGACSFAVESNVPDAMVYVDDVLLGTAAEWAAPGHAIKPGFHRVEVRHPDYYSTFHDADCAAGSSFAVKANLHKVVD